MRIQIKETFDIVLKEVVELIKKDPDVIKTIGPEPVGMIFDMSVSYRTFQ